MYGFVSLDSIPLEPHFRQARQSGAIEFTELDEGAFYLGLLAAAHRVPFYPTRAGLGSDMLTMNPELRTVTSPYDDGEELVAIPAFKLDAALIHMNRADAAGNGQFLGPDLYFDDLFAMAADRTYLSTEKIVSTENLLDEGPVHTLRIQRIFTDGVVEAPQGAHFTECPPDYGRDEAFQRSTPPPPATPRPGMRSRPRTSTSPPMPTTGRRWRPDHEPARRSNHRRDLRGGLRRGLPGDGEILCNPIGTVPIVGGRLARATFEPDLVYTDTVSVLPANNFPVGDPDAPKVVESWVPYRTVFDIVWSGKRHVMMGASQIDQWGNQNIAAIGDFRQPKAQLLGLRGAPGNLVNHTTSYWGAQPLTRSFVASVDVVSGPGYDRMRELGAPSNRDHEVRRVVSNLGVFDFQTNDNRMRIASIHPGVTLEQVVEATAFELAGTDDVAETRLPTDEELHLIREVLDPTGARKAEFR